MLEINPCFRGLFGPQKSVNDLEKMEVSQHGVENFTNFSINEILKPDFGKKHLTVGVLNLSVERRTFESSQVKRQKLENHDFKPHNRTNSIGFNIDLFTRERLGGLSKTFENLKNTIPNVTDISSLNRSSALSLDLSNKCATSLKQQKQAECRNFRDTSGSGGESPTSSPGNSPSGSPASRTSVSPGSPGNKDKGHNLWPAWVYCTRYSDRPSAGPRSRKIKRKERTADDKRPRTAFSTEQLRKLKQEFENSKYLTENRRQQLARELNLNESQIKIWFQNKRAKIKKGSGEKNELAMELIAQGLYNHKTIPVKSET